MAEQFTAADFGIFLDCKERFFDAVSIARNYVTDGGVSFSDMDPEQAEAYRALGRMEIAFLDLKELFYQALASEARGAHLISAEYYSQLEQMNEALKDMGFDDGGL